MAIDAQGAEKVRPFTEAAGASFRTLVDEDNLLSGLYGFKAVPNALFVDEDGVLRYMKFGGFDIARTDCARAAREWAGDGAVATDASASPDTSQDSHAGAMELFGRGMDMYRAGQVEEAVGLWREAVALEPDNYVIRKQIWAVENPGKFYAGDVDYGWQKEQLARGL